MPACLSLSEQPHAKHEACVATHSASESMMTTWALGEAPSSQAGELGSRAPTSATLPAPSLPLGAPPFASPSSRSSPPTAPDPTIAPSPSPLLLGPVIGLTNLGNTCYLNAAMQLLLSCPPLLQELRKHHKAMAQHMGEGLNGQQQPQQQHTGSPFPSQLLPGPPPASTSNPSQQQQLEAAAAASHFGRGPLGFALQQAILQASGDGPYFSSGVYNPQALLAAVRKQAPNLKGRQQQDSHEVLHLVLEGMEAEERRSRLAAARQAQQQQQQGMSLRGGRVVGAGAAVGASTASGLDPRLEQWVAAPTLVERVCGGRLASAITCCSCGFESVSSEPFLDLSLPLPQEWSSLPDQPQHTASSWGGVGTRAAGAGAAGAAGSRRIRGLDGDGAAQDGSSGGWSGTGIDADAVRARVPKRKSSDGPRGVPMLPASSGLCFPPACAYASTAPGLPHALPGLPHAHAAGHRACPTSHVPGGHTIRVLRLQPVAAAAPDAHAEAANAGSSSSSSSSAFRAAPGNGCAAGTVSAPAVDASAAAPPAEAAQGQAQAQGAMTRAKARRLCEPSSGNGNSNSLLTEQLAASGVSPTRNRSQQQHLQPAVGGMDVDSLARPAPAAPSAPAQPLRGFVVADAPAVAAAAAAVAAASVPEHSGNSSSICRQMGKLWVGQPQECGAALTVAAPRPAPHLRACLNEFFQKETIHWDCPKEKGASPRAAPAGGVGAAAGAGLSRSLPSRRQPVAWGARVRRGLDGLPPTAPDSAAPSSRRAQHRNAAGPASGVKEEHGSGLGLGGLPPGGQQSSSSSLEHQGADQLFAMEDVGGSEGGQRRSGRRRKSVDSLDVPGAAAAAAGGAGAVVPQRLPQRRQALARQRGVPWQQQAAPGGGGSAPLPIPGSLPNPLPGGILLPGSLPSGPSGDAQQHVPRPLSPPAGRCSSQRATKSYQLQAVPPVLLVHLKRFRRDERGSMKKIGVHVDFDFEVQMELPREQQQAASAAAGAAVGAAAANLPAVGGVPVLSLPGGGGASGSASRLYKLVGLVEHIGSMKSGHYVAYVCRHQDGGPLTDAGGALAAQQQGQAQAQARQQWYFVSDTTVRAVTREQVSAAQAYILMYISAGRAE